ncbi:hypothetical protein [Kitasatospora sp. NPDC058190]|uniref:hypothetical protein n=1 Tax=Kitasatospora sp. NPDC058190 TaxID=3346371 RepID=UPI0036DD901D
MAPAPVLTYVAGWHASRSGGLVEVERWFNRPVLLVGAATVLIVVSLIVELDFRTRLSQVGCAAGLVALVFGGVPIVVLSYVFGDEGRWVERKIHPDHPDRVLTVTDIAFSIDPIYRVELVTGSGWSARHWNLGTWDADSGDFTRVEWSAPDRITVTGRTELRVFDVHSDGSLSEPRVLPR